MTPENFCYWLQGRAELQPDPVPTAEEWKVIKEHLVYVFDYMAKVEQPTPPRVGSTSIDVEAVVKRVLDRNVDLQRRVRLC